MKNYIKQVTFLTLAAAIIAVSNAIPADAQTRAYRASDQQIRTLLTRIENRTDTFKNQVDQALDNSNIDGTRQEDSLNSVISNFEESTNRLRDNFSSNRSSANDVQDVLQRAVSINNFVRNNRLSSAAQRTWTSIRTDLNTLASYYRVSSNWNAAIVTPQNIYIGSDTQVRNLIAQIESRTNNFKRQIGRNLNNSNVDGTSREDSINSMVANFEMATNRLKNNFSSRRSTASDVQQVLSRAVSINSFVANNNLSNPAENSWAEIRNDLNTLAGYYRVSSNWNNTVIDQREGQWSNGYGNFDSRLTGTYRLNASRSDNVSTMIDRAIGQYQSNDRDRMRNNLERRLRSPETLTFEKRGQTLTMSSSNAQSVTLNADGVKRSETSPNGRTVTTSVVSNNSDLTITYDGDRTNDFFVTFAPTNNGQLRVTRRVYLENMSETITVSSIYDKTSQTADWNNTAGQPVFNGGPTGGFTVPNNTAMVATLDSALSTRTARDGERFTMTVNSPSQFDGAVIEGSVVGKQSGVVSGRASMSLTFTSIRMPDGRTYQFAGIIDQVREANGNIITVDNEGAIRDRSQTTQTATRTGIGAVLGAIIGAIAGGGSGAAIGAGVGAGAGAGTVILQGRDNLELGRGAQFSLTATSPSNVGVR
jgi:hypothetical protein